MRKIITILFAAISAMILFCSISIWALFSPNEFLYGGTTTISVSADTSILNASVRERLAYIPDKYGVSLSKMTWTDNHTLNLFSTDLSFGGKINLMQGVFSQNHLNTFLSNKDTGEKAQTGSFQLFYPDTTVILYPFNELESRSGYLGLCQLHTQDEQTVQQILDYLNTYVGPSDVYSTYLGGILQTAYDWLEDAPFLLVLIFLTGILFLFLIIRYSIFESRTVAILAMNGFGRWRILGYHAKQLLPCVLCSLLVCFTGLFITLKILDGIFLLLAFCGIAIILHLILYALSLLILSIAVTIQLYNSIRILNGKRPFAFLAVLQWLLKYSVLTALLFGISQSSSLFIELNRQYSANNQWEQAEGIYRIRTKFVTEDPNAARELHHKGASVYQAMEQEAGMIMIDASNYMDMGDMLLWEINTAGKSSIHSVNGPCITINENYLKTHSVCTSNGENVLSLLEREDNVWNVLVPEKLASNESTIINTLQQDFYFQKIGIQESVYPDEPVDNDITSEELRINIIYIPDNTSYFTYDSTILPDSQNEIVDPIVIVDGHNVDNSLYYSYMTRCCYFPADAFNPIEPLLTVAAEHDAVSLYSSASPIFDERAETMKDLERGLQQTFLVCILLSIGMVLCIYLFCACWYVQHITENVIKRLHGYGFLKIYGWLLLFNIGITTILSMLFPMEVPISIKIAVPLIDFITTLICCISVEHKSINSTLKGEY